MHELKPTPIWIDQNFIGAYPSTETNSKIFYRIARSKFKWGLVTNFLILIKLRNETHHTKDHVKISHFAKFEVV